MSHFVVAVVIGPEFAEKKEEEINAEVIRLLAPYDETIEAPEYQRECYCVNRAARKAGREAAEAAMPLDGLRKEFDDKYARLQSDPMWSFSDEAQAIWTKMIAPHTQIENEVIVAHPLFGKPDPECEECGGVGTNASTYNPKSKWDWWVIGGRWDGWISRQESLPDDGNFPYSPQYKDVNRNIVKVKRLNSSDLPFSYVAPDGSWHQKGDMGWWGMTRNEVSSDTWKEEWEKLIAEYPEHIAVGVDCHI